MNTPEAEAPQAVAKPPPRKRIDLLRRFAKDAIASAEVTDLGLIKSVGSKTINFGGEDGQMWRGIPSLMCILGLGLCGFSAVFFGNDLIQEPPGSWARHPIYVILSLLMELVYVAGGLLFLLYFYTLTFFLPSDDSVIFDRGNRKVHWVSMQLAGKTRRSALKRPVIEVRSVDWDLVDAEHRVIVKVNTASASRDHDLAFVVRKSATDTTVVDEFGIAPSMLLGETTVPALWEHIRRYMEEDGPPLPPGVTEPNPTVPKPRNWWQSMGLVGPFGPKYLQWWRKQPGLTLAAHVLLPMSLPIYLAWGTLNWLTYATEQKVQWPQDVLNALGPSLDSRSIEASKGDALQPMRVKG